MFVLLVDFWTGWKSLCCCWIFGSLGHVRESLVLLLDFWTGWGKFGVVGGFLDMLGKVCVVGGFSSCLLCPSHHSGGGSDRTAETLLNCGISFARHSPHQPFAGACFPIFLFLFSQS